VPALPLSDHHWVIAPTAVGVLLQIEDPGPEPELPVGLVLLSNDWQPFA
jgi:hypothetical protein